MIRLLQIPMLAIIIAVTCIHAHRFAANKPINGWFHFLWGLVYAAPASFFILEKHSWWLLLAFTLERFIFYNPILNIFRTEKFFYIVADNSKPGFWDKIEVWWAGFYKYIWFLVLAGYIYIQFLHV